MITEDYVSFEIAKLLKEKWFKECCSYCYGVAVLHNGVAISFDEECELKDEGKKNEIEYIEGGTFHNYRYINSNTDANVWAAPTHQMAMKWLREVHNRYVEICMDKAHNSKDIVFRPAIYDKKLDCLWESDNFPTYEEACEAAIKYCLENLI